MIIAICVGLIAYALFRNGKINNRSFKVLPILSFYLSFVITITIIERLPSYNAQYNLVLFWSYQAIARGELGLISQVLWNIVLFIPIGLLLMLLLTNKHKYMFALLFGILHSILVEVVQLISHRGLFEFDDIVHNTLGAIIGMGIYIIVKSIKKRFMKDSNNV